MQDRLHRRHNEIPTYLVPKSYAKRTTRLKTKVSGISKSKGELKATTKCCAFSKRAWILAIMPTRTFALSGLTELASSALGAHRHGLPPRRMNVVHPVHACLSWVCALGALQGVYQLERLAVCKGALRYPGWAERLCLRRAAHVKRREQFTSAPCVQPG